MSIMKEFFDKDDLRLMTVEECAGHTIDYAAGWKACIDWIKSAPAANVRSVPDSGAEMKDNNMNDLISRQWLVEGIEAGRTCFDTEKDYNRMIHLVRDITPAAQQEQSTEIQEILEYLDTTLHPIVSPDNWNVYAELHDMVSSLPSARLEPDDISEEKKQPLGDLISRQEAIDLVDKYFKMIELNGEICIDGLISLPTARPESLTNDDFESIRSHLNAYKEKLCNLRRWKEAEELQNIIDRFIAFASARPEPLTDQERRIFLAAMEKEEKVCKQVDKNLVRESYEDSLIQICKEIRRKVKDALWT